MPLVNTRFTEFTHEKSIKFVNVPARQYINKLSVSCFFAIESKKRKQKNWEEDDFYDSDEDTFLDRTGDIEKKRSMRMQKAGKVENKAETYDSLVSETTRCGENVKVSV